MPGYKVAVSNGVQPNPTPVVIEGGDNVTVFGSGTSTDPYIIAADANVEAGEHVTVTGTGKPGNMAEPPDPYVISAEGGGGPADSITGLIKPGDNVTVTGEGTNEAPYVITVKGAPATAIKDLIKAGQHVTITGTGTTADPYVINAASGGAADSITDLIFPGDNITIDGEGTLRDPYIINGTPGPASSIAGLVRGGKTVRITGGGTTESPYHFESPVTGLLIPGDNVTILGDGTPENPYTIDVEDMRTFLAAGTNNTLTGTGDLTNPYRVHVEDMRAHLAAGGNITITGTGTATDPYVITASSGDGQRTYLVSGGHNTVSGSGTQADPYKVDVEYMLNHLEAGRNVTVDGDGSVLHPWRISAHTAAPKRGPQEELWLYTNSRPVNDKKPRVRRNADGSATLLGGVGTVENLIPGAGISIARLPSESWYAAEGAAFPTIARVYKKWEPDLVAVIPIYVDISDQYLTAMGYSTQPDQWMQILLDGMTYWPVGT